MTGWRRPALLVGVLFAITGFWLNSGNNVRVVTIQPNQIEHLGGYSYRVMLEDSPFYESVGDSVEEPSRSRTRVKEDGVGLLHRHATHTSISAEGSGRYSHWGDELHFSSSDGSDPRINGKVYEIVLVRTLSTPICVFFLLSASILILVPLLNWFRRREDFDNLLKEYLAFVLELRTLKAAWVSAALLLLLVTYLMTYYGFPVRQSVEPSDMRHSNGYTYTTSVSNPRVVWGVIPARFFSAPGDSSEFLDQSTLRLYEDGIAFPELRGHMQVQFIDRHGNGRYVHRDNALYFSSSDRTDPRTNNRQYSFVRYFYPNEGYVSVVLAALFWACAALLALAAIWLQRIQGVSTRITLVSGLVSVLAISLSLSTAGVILVLSMGIAVGALIIFFGSLLAGLSPRLFRHTFVEAPAGVVMTLISVVFCMVVAEAGVGFVDYLAEQRGLEQSVASDAATATIEITDPRHEVFPAEALRLDAARQGFATMPQDWEYKPVDVAGATRAYYWQDALHVHNEDLFRRSSPLPGPAEEGVFRIAVFGDSLTYGYGIDYSWTYSAQLEEMLREEFGCQVEVLNLGINGHQSEDILYELNRFYDQLQPDLVVYGITQNDMLDAGEGQGANRTSLPYYLIENSRLAAFLNIRIDRLARELGISLDYYGDILKSASYEARFTKDVAAIGAAVVDRGGEPVIAMVMDQFPGRNDRSLLITQLMEKAMNAASMDVIETAPYYEKWWGSKFEVSAWEPHPNEMGNFLFARLFFERIMTYRDKVVSSCRAN